MRILGTLPGVEALAAGPERLYLASDTRLWSVDPDSLTELSARTLDPRQYNAPLHLNPQANRLYLGRGRPWSLETFAADSLNPVDSYPLVDHMTHATVSRTGRRLFTVEMDARQAVLRARDANGRPLAAPPPLVLADDVFGDLSLAFLQGGPDGDGQTLFVAGGKYDDYSLDAFALPNLAPLDSLPLPNKPYDLAVDAESGLLYAAYGGSSNYLLALDPTTGPVETIYTARKISDALVDPAQDRLYVLDDGGRLHVLSLADYKQIARLETGFNIFDGRFSGYGQLSLDGSRHRLYIGGDPVRIADTDTLQMVTPLDGRGQVTPDPTGDRLYLTSPCACRMEQCNTLILSAATLTGTQTLFPVEEPLTAPCVVATHLDAENQLLYARIYNGVPGSNSGDYYSVFDVSEQPEELYTAFDISYGNVALDTLRGRAFAPRYRISRSFIHRFELQDDTISQTLELVGAHGELAYDPGRDRLYAVQEETLQVFDGDLTLVAETSLPGEFNLLTFDPQGQRLYLADPNGTLAVVATSGGQLEPPPPATSTADQPAIGQLLAAPDGTLFRVYDHRLYGSDDEGRSWDLLGTGLPGRLVGDLAISPSYEKDSTLLAGLWDFGFAGGLYRSTDGGNTWLPTTRGLTDLQISMIRFSPTFARDRTIFLTTLDHGLFRSSDRGDTWKSLAGGYAVDEYDSEVTHLAVSPTFADDNLIVISKRHLLRSTDGGESWQDMGAPGGLVAFSPNYRQDGLILSSGRWRSTDWGETWQPAAVGREPGVAREILFSPAFASDQTVYVLLEGDHGAPRRLQRSVDAGRTWHSLLGGTPTGFEISLATIGPTGELLLSGLDGQHLTTQAKTLVWGRPTVDIARLDLQALAIAIDGTIYLANNDAGIFKSADGGRSWVETEFPARAHQILQPAQLAIAADGTLFGTAGTVVARSNQGGQAWTHLDDVPIDFEIASLAVSPSFAVDGIVLIGGTHRNSQIRRSADRGETWELVFDGTTVGVKYASDVSSIAFSPDFARDETVYGWLQDAGLLRSIDGGLSWELMAESDFFGQSLALSPDGDRLYLGALYGHTLVSEDGGQNWLDLRENIPDERTWSSALAFGPDDTIFLGTDRGVYRSQDKGETWARASAGLPLRVNEGIAQGVRALGFQDGSLYAALVEGGLFVSDDLGESWRDSVTERPASPIQTLAAATPEVHPLSGTNLSTPTPPAVTLPDCPVAPERFVDLWAVRVDRLGCPAASSNPSLVEQIFEGGWMFWRGDTATIYVLPSDQPYASFQDTWDESQPIFTCPDLFPSRTPPTPHRGFGKVWCNEPWVRERVGNATSPERLFEATLQEFETGLIFETDQGTTYILESRLSGWERME